MIQKLEKNFPLVVELLRKIHWYITHCILIFDQYSRFAIRLKKFRFSVKNAKTNYSKVDKALHLSVELVETNPLMYNIKQLK